MATVTVVVVTVAPVGCNTFTTSWNCPDVMPPPSSSTWARESTCCAEDWRPAPGGCAAVVSSALARASSPGSPPVASDVASASMADPSASVGAVASGRANGASRGTPRIPSAGCPARAARRVSRRGPARRWRRRGPGDVGPEAWSVWRHRTRRGEARVARQRYGARTGTVTVADDCGRVGRVPAVGSAGAKPQRLEHVACRREPVVWIRGQCATRHVAEWRWKPLCRRTTGTWALPGQHLHHDRADRVEVRLHCRRFACSPFRGQIAGRTQDDSGHCHVVGQPVRIPADVEALGDTEVGDPSCARPVPAGCCSA